jgi:hypothetical protein
MVDIANAKDIYWNNYYIWDEKNKPNIVVYRHGINFHIFEDYTKLLNEAITKSIEYTDYFVKE